MADVLWMDEEDVVHINNGILLIHKKEWNNAIYSNMDGPEMIILTEVKKRKTNTKYHIVPPVCGI